MLQKRLEAKIQQPWPRNQKQKPTMGGELLASLLFLVFFGVSKVFVVFFRKHKSKDCVFLFSASREANAPKKTLWLLVIASLGSHKNIEKPSSSVWSPKKLKHKHSVFCFCFQKCKPQGYPGYFVPNIRGPEQSVQKPCWCRVRRQKWEIQ